jgi:hypothetical protein
LREECKLRVFENRMLRRVFGPKRYKVTGEWRGVHRVLVKKPEGKRTLGRRRHRWEDNIKMDLEV